MNDHGYVRYTHGCRCEVCRTAKREYTRAIRAPYRRALKLVRERGEGRHYVDGITHGYSAYQNYNCRCDVCTAGKAEYWQASKGKTR